MNAVLNCLQQGIVYTRGVLGEAQVNQHLNRSQEQTRWVSTVFSRNIGGTPVDRFKECAVIAYIGRARQPHRARDLRGDIGENIPVEVGRDNHIKTLWCVRNPCSANIDDHVLRLNIQVLKRDLLKNLAEETVGELHDIVLAHASHLRAVVLAGILKRVADNLFAARAANELEALNYVVGLSVLDSCVEIFLILTDDHQV